MSNIAITGSNGFLGKNLSVYLAGLGFAILPISHEEKDLAFVLSKADALIHLAGVNRPKDGDYSLNVSFSQKIVDALKEKGRKIPVLFASSTQAELDNPYGRSKKEAEAILSQLEGYPLYFMRLPNLYGKWGRPNYNSVVATFCFNVGRGLPIRVDDPSAEVKLAYVDDVCGLIEDLLPCAEPGVHTFSGGFPVTSVTVGELANLIKGFEESRRRHFVPSLSSAFVKKLYSTYTSYLPLDELEVGLTTHEDERGSFTEAFKTEANGQVCVNKIRPGITKGNHFHYLKTERFLVVSGKADIKMRKVGEKEIAVFHLSGENMATVDIPTGYTHSITNVGEDEAVVLIWGNGLFNPSIPDTYANPVEGGY